MANLTIERSSSVAKCRTCNQVSPDSNPPLLPFRRLGVFVLSIDAPVDKYNTSHVERSGSAVECTTRNQASPGSNPPLLPCRRLGIFVQPIDS